MGLIRPNGSVNPKPNREPLSMRLRRLFNFRPNFRAWAVKLKAKLFSVRGVAIILVVVGLAILAGILYSKYFSNNSNPAVASKDPCSFFTLQDAQALLGKNAQKGGVPPVVRASSKDATITTCSYTQSSVTRTSGPVINPKSAAVVVGTPETDSGKAFNEYEFTQSPLTKMQAISGYGDKAYWDNTLGVLNVYKNGKWIMISNGSVTSASGRTLDDAKKLADVVVSRL